MFEKNQIYKNVKVIDYTHDGMGICKINGFLLFVMYGKINETYNIKITKQEKNFAYAMIIENDINVKCDHYKSCGGCDIMHLSYQEQVEFKKIKLQNLIKKFHLDTSLDDFITTEEQFHYRNKIQMPFTSLNNEIKIGFFKKRSHEVLPINKCHIQSELVNKLFKLIEKLMNDTKQTVYQEDKHSGLLRHLYIRETLEEQIMVCFVINGESLKEQKYLISEITKNFKQVTSIIINVNKRRTNAVLGFKNLNLYNKNYIEEQLNGYTFRLLPNAFFQVNTNQTIKLYDQAIKAGGLKKTDLVLDAFCGVGSIGIYLSKHVNSVIGIEISEQAIKSANINKTTNNIDNISFICKDANKEITQLAKNNFDVVYVDPPRKGIGQEFIKSLLKAKPSRIVYISCDPATLSRDLSSLAEQYLITSFVGVDMFANTHHVETVVGLSLK